MRRLRERPAAASTVDRYDDDRTRLAWVQVLATATGLDVAGHDDVLAALARRYLAYRERPPRGPLLRLAPTRALWSRASG